MLFSLPALLSRLMEDDRDKMMMIYNSPFSSLSPPSIIFKVAFSGSHRRVSRVVNEIYDQKQKPGAKSKGLTISRNRIRDLLEGVTLAYQPLPMRLGKSKQVLILENLAKFERESNLRFDLRVNKPQIHSVPQKFI